MTRTSAARRGASTTASAKASRSPYAIDVRLLGRRAGAMRTESRTVPAPTGLGDEVVGVPPGEPVALDLRLESVTEGVLVSGTVRASVHGECARCLDPVTSPLSVEVQELFAWPASVTDETTAEDEVHRIQGEHVDLEPVIRDAVVLALPWTPVCRDDCRGLCPDCGGRLDDLPADHTHETLDPRWAALQRLVPPQPDNSTDRGE